VHVVLRDRLILQDQLLQGLSEFSMYCIGSGDHFITSIFSPLSSFTTCWMRAPRAPMHAPTGSTSFSVLSTATFVLGPTALEGGLASLETATILTEAS